MRIFCAVAIIALWAGAAYAQDTHVQRYGEEDPDKTPEQIRSEKADSKAYQRSLGNIPNQAPTDPWGTARGTDSSKSAAKAAPKPAKPAPDKTAKTTPKPGVSAN
jgi:hypothetical protein